MEEYSSIARAGVRNDLTLARHLLSHSTDAPILITIIGSSFSHSWVREPFLSSLSSAADSTRSVPSPSLPSRALRTPLVVVGSVGA